MIRAQTSDLIPQVLAMPERNRKERRKKAHHCRAIVRSGYFRKHGNLANAAPALRDAATRETYTKRLMQMAPIFLRLYDKEEHIADTRWAAARAVLPR